MATQQELTTAFQGLEQRFGLMEAGYQAEVARLQQEVQALQHAQQQTAQVRVSPGHMGGIDTRIIGKPDTFTGKQEAWKDWAIVLRSYSAASTPILAPLMEKSEGADEDVRNTVLSMDQAAASTQLYYLLIMCCRDSALTRIVNVGVSEGLLAWRALCRHHNPSSAARHASLLLDLLAFSFEGDVQARLEEYDRVVAQYESITKQRFQDDIRLGVVVRQLPEGPLRQHILLNLDRYNSYSKVKEEIIAVVRAQSAAMSAPMPMDISAMQTKGSWGKGAGKGDGKGKGKGGQNGGKGQQAQQSKGKDKGKGKGGQNGGKGQQTQQQQQQQQRQGGTQRNPNADRKCWHCGKKGHLQSECRSRPAVSAVDDQQQQQQQQQPQNPAALPSLYLAAVSMSSDSPLTPNTKEQLRLGVDSGSAATVIPAGSLPQFATEKDSIAGRAYSSATGQPIKDLGVSHVYGRTRDGRRHCVRARRAKVAKGLISVHDLLATGHKVVFEQDQSTGIDMSCAIHQQSGKIIPFELRNRVWDVVLDIDGEQAETAPMLAPFVRQARP
eukprot:6468960-Amphidinium_carterae.1